ncbi:MAG TPA: RsmE family RNA methyltransferase [bacterium]|nr:RsmE family RNA methyltransferase [bacterium]
MRRLRRFFSDQPIVRKGQTLTLPPSETHHLKDILRLVPGSRCLLTDGKGIEAEAKVLKFLAGGQCLLLVSEIMKRAARNHKKLKLRVIQALAQKKTVDNLIEKAQEIGLDEFWPVQTKHSVVRMDNESQTRVLARWQKKAEEAAKQSGSLKLIGIAPIQTFKEAVCRISQSELVAFFHPGMDAIPFREWLESLRSQSLSRQTVCNLFFGPEGGFAKEEIDFLINQSESKNISCKIVSLGETILKIDTAFLGVTAALRLLL